MDLHVWRHDISFLANEHNTIIIIIVTVVIVVVASTVAFQVRTDNIYRPVTHIAARAVVSFLLHSPGGIDDTR